VPGLAGQNEDIAAFAPTSLGNTTAGSWSLYFDGNAVGLTGYGVDGLAVDAAGAIYLSPQSTVKVAGLTIHDEDVAVFIPTSLGNNTAGAFDPVLYFDGIRHGVGGDLKAIDIPAIDAPLLGEKVVGVTESNGTTAASPLSTAADAQQIMAAVLANWATALPEPSVPDSFDLMNATYRPGVRRLPDAQQTTLTASPDSKVQLCWPRFEPGATSDIDEFFGRFAEPLDIVGQLDTAARSRFPRRVSVLDVIHGHVDA